ncbi:hypothetical protein GJAV_G00165690 [Gymnothorax javanicus]|nr:hypothetical protein GJAV_G00165690 [Gymnothorax javanicus]
MNDFSYLHTNCFEVTVELSCDKFPHVSELPTEWENNKESLLIYMEQVHRGIKGLVLDKDTKGGIANAVIKVDDIDHHIRSAPSGDYWRLLNPGEYEVTASAEGYYPVTRTCRVEYHHYPTLCDFHLAKTLKQRLLDILSKGGKIPKNVKERLHKLRLRSTSELQMMVELALKNVRANWNNKTDMAKPAANDFGLLAILQSMPSETIRQYPVSREMDEKGCMFNAAENQAAEPADQADGNGRLLDSRDEQETNSPPTRIAKKRRRTEEEKRCYNQEKYPLLGPCSDKCRRKCAERVSEEERKNINETFWTLSFEGRRGWFGNNIAIVPVKRRKVQADDMKQRDRSLVYSLPMQNGLSQTVCKIMFLHTLGLKTDGMIAGYVEAICNEETAISPTTDNRGRRVPVNKVDADHIRQHISGYYWQLSQYTREHAPNRRYLDSYLTISENGHVFTAAENQAAEPADQADGNSLLLDAQDEQETNSPPTRIAKKRRRTEEEKRCYNQEKYPLLGPCSDKCRRKCAERVSEEERKNINETFWTLSFEGRRGWFGNNIAIVPVKRRKVQAGDMKQRDRSLVYSLPMQNGLSQTVCKIMFLHTLGLKTDGMITGYVEAKCNEETAISPTTNNRGRRVPVNKVDADHIRQHISWYYWQLSQYTREHAPNRRYLDSYLTISENGHVFTAAENQAAEPADQADGNSLLLDARDDQETNSPPTRIAKKRRRTEEEKRCYNQEKYPLLGPCSDKCRRKLCTDPGGAVTCSNFAAERASSATMAEFQIRKYHDEDQEAVKETFALAMEEHVPATFLHMLKQPLTQATLACVFCLLLATSGSLLLPLLSLALILAGARQLVDYCFSRYLEVCYREGLAHVRQAYMEGADSCFWVAESGGRVVGTVACRPSKKHPDKECLELKRMAVRMSHRGLGIGKSLCRVVAEFALEKGYSQVVLYSSVVQTDAQLLYEGMGYRRVGESVVPELLAKLMNFTLIEYRYKLMEDSG